MLDACCPLGKRTGDAGHERSFQILLQGWVPVCVCASLTVSNRNKHESTKHEPYTRNSKRSVNASRYPADWIPALKLRHEVGGHTA